MCLCFTQSLTNGSNVIVKIVNSRYTNNNDKKALKRVCDIWWVNGLSPIYRLSAAFGRVYVEVRSMIMVRPSSNLNTKRQRDTTLHDHLTTTYTHTELSIAMMTTRINSDHNHSPVLWPHTYKNTNKQANASN